MVKKGPADQEDMSRDSSSCQAGSRASNAKAMEKVASSSLLRNWERGGRTVGCRHRGTIWSDWATVAHWRWPTQVHIIFIMIISVFYDYNYNYSCNQWFVCVWFVCVVVCCVWRGVCVFGFLCVVAVLFSP